MHILCITNNKGGVAKTTSGVNIAYAMADKGYKVLVVDRTYGRERVIRPNKLYPVEEKGIIASICAFAVSNSLHGKFPRIAGTGTFSRPLSGSEPPFRSFSA